MKKLLILGGTNNEVSIVEKAKSMGIYTIVTDSHTDLDRSPAKRAADEYWNISWSDIPALEAKCKQEKVDGVLAGYDELRLDNLIELCDCLNLPCYINKQQLDITRNKVNFKNWCAKFGIPVVKEYSVDDKDIRFPVIIKPVDRAGSIGINVAYNKEQYDKFLDVALSLSPSKTVIVEDFIAEGVKFDCYYVINNSEVDLMGTCDTLMHSKSTKGHETIQKAWVIPSLFDEHFRNHYDELFKNMIRHLGFKNGYADISCFYKDGICYVFEAGFRLGGGHSFDYQYATSGNSYMQTMINHSLGLPVNEYKRPDHQAKAIIYSIYMNPTCVERIKSIEGLDFLENDKRIITIVPQLNVNSEVQPGKPIKFAMITVLADTFEEVRNKIDMINKTVYVKTETNVYYSDSDVSDEVLRKYWNE